jgi:glycosyltransferase involved in cell wall biosynthesis
MVDSVLLIVHSLPPLDFSGTPLLALGYARELVRRGIRVGVLYPVQKTDGPALATVPDPMDHFTRYEVRNPARTWFEWSLRDASDGTPPRAGELPNVLDSFKPAIVHIIDSVNLPGEWTDLIASRGIPIVRHVWNTEDLCGLIEPVSATPPNVICPAPLTPHQCAQCCFRRFETINLSQTSWSAQQLLDALLARREQKVAECEQLLATKRRQAIHAFTEIYRRIIFPTRSFRDFFEKTIPLPGDRTLVIEHGINMPAPAPARPRDRGSRPRFLFLSALLAKKGIGDVVTVFTHPELLTRDYELIIAGSGHPQPLAPLLDANPRARFLSTYAPEQLPSLLAQADIGLSPSRFETFHRVTREYLAAGLPVIGSDAFGIPDAIRDGVNGLLFQAGDCEGFRRAVLRVLDEPHLIEHLALGARQTVVRSISSEMDEIIEQYALATAAR